MRSAVPLAPVANAIVGLCVLRGIAADVVESMAVRCESDYIGLQQHLWHDVFSAVAHIGLCRDELWIHFSGRLEIHAIISEFRFASQLCEGDVLMLLLVPAAQRPDRSAVLLAVQSAMIGERALRSASTFLGALSTRHNFANLCISNVECVLGNVLSAHTRDAIQSLRFFNPRELLDAKRNQKEVRNESSVHWDDKDSFTLHASQGDIDLFVASREKAKLEREVQKEHLRIVVERERQEQQRLQQLRMEQRHFVQLQQEQQVREQQSQIIAEAQRRDNVRQVFDLRQERAKINANCRDAWAVRTSRHLHSSHNSAACQNHPVNSSSGEQREFPMQRVVVQQEATPPSVPAPLLNSHNSEYKCPSTLHSASTQTAPVEPVVESITRDPQQSTSRVMSGLPPPDVAAAVLAATSGLSRDDLCVPLTPTRHSMTQTLLSNVVRREAEGDGFGQCHHRGAPSSTRSPRRRLVWSPQRQFYSEERKICSRTSDVRAAAIAEVANATLRAQKLYYYNPESQRVYSFRPGP